MIIQGKAIKYKIFNALKPEILEENVNKFLSEKENGNSRFPFYVKSYWSHHLRMFMADLLYELIEVPDFEEEKDPNVGNKKAPE
jgi:hypothetical protein